jgi:hypothetical protein
MMDYLDLLTCRLATRSEPTSPEQKNNRDGSGMGGGGVPLVENRLDAELTCPTPSDPPLAPISFVKFSEPVGVMSIESVNCVNPTLLAVPSPTVLLPHVAVSATLATPEPSPKPSMLSTRSSISQPMQVTE